MTGSSAFLFLALVNLSLTGVDAVQVRNKMNPIRRVVTLLQEMAKKTTEEGEQKAAMYENLECYCGTTSQELKTNEKKGTARITNSTSKIHAEEGILVELKTVIKVSQESRVEKRWISQFGILEELFVFDPELQKNLVSGQTWELKAPASLRRVSCTLALEGAVKGPLREVFCGFQMRAAT